MGSPVTACAGPSPTPARGPRRRLRIRAARAYGPFVAAKDITAALAKARAGEMLTGGNGPRSRLEEGRGLAATALQGRHGPTRIVALTDALLRSHFRDALADPAPEGDKALAKTVLGLVRRIRPAICIVTPAGRGPTREPRRLNVERER